MPMVRSAKLKVITPRARKEALLAIKMNRDIFLRSSCEESHSSHHSSTTLDHGKSSSLKKHHKAAAAAKAMADWTTPTTPSPQHMASQSGGIPSAVPAYLCISSSNDVAAQVMRNIVVRAKDVINAVFAAALANRIPVSNIASRPVGSKPFTGSPFAYKYLCSEAGLSR